MTLAIALAWAGGHADQPESHPLVDGRHASPREVVPERIPGAKPRNVVFILSDDHRYDAMSFMGHPFAQDARTWTRWPPTGCT